MDDFSYSYAGWFIKTMSPLAFKSNNSRPMRCTTLQYTAFERADNFLSNECIHTRFPFQMVSSQAANKYSSGFCGFRFRRTRKISLPSFIAFWFEGLSFAWNGTWHFLQKEKLIAEQLKLRSHHCPSTKAPTVPVGCFAIRQEFALPGPMSARSASSRKLGL